MELAHDMLQTGSSSRHSGIQAKIEVVTHPLCLAFLAYKPKGAIRYRAFLLLSQHAYEERGYLQSYAPAESFNQA